MTLREHELTLPLMEEAVRALKVGDVLDADSLSEAFQGVHTAYYLIHSMAAGGDYAERDRKAAYNFSQAALAAGVKKVIYLGGLAHGEDLSAHLASRIEVGEILRAGGVPTVELRASVIIDGRVKNACLLELFTEHGAGSMIRPD